MRVLVTGVTGAIGRAMARQLLAAGHAVSGIARHSHDHLDRDVDFVCAALDGPVLQRLADESDVVLNLAPVDPTAPGGVGINGLVHVTHAAARAGARLIFVSQAAGEPKLYRHAEQLVSTGWAPSLIVRTAPPVGRQLDWAVCRTVATLLRAKDSLQPVRLLHLDDLIRFLTLAVTANTTGVADLATPDTTNPTVARHLLRSVDQPPRRAPVWEDLTPGFDTAALQDVWQFDCGWSATDAVADTARGLFGRKFDAGGTADLPGRMPLPLEPWSGPAAGTPLHCAAPDGLEGEFDDRVDPRFPVFSAAPLAEALPGPLTPMTLDVQLGGLRLASRVIGQAIALGGVVAGEWSNRAVAVFGHRAYVGVSTGVMAARQLPGWNEQAVIDHSLAGAQVGELLPRGRPPVTGGLLGSAAKAVVATRALAMLRHLKTETAAYSDAAAAEHLDAAHLSALSDAGLQVRIYLLRERIQQGWGLTALWLIDTGITAAALERTAASTPVSGVGALLESRRVSAEIAELAVMLRRDPRVHALAAHGDLAGIRALAQSAAAEIDSVVARIGHRAPGEAELANPVFGDDPAMLLVAAAAAPIGQEPTADTLAERLTANARLSRETAHDTTMRFTHELRMT
ncbi:MAG: NAD-dependent epimerase/dehydratase family protein, partial [Mycobacterium sp.]